jgi:hypothetical protein
MNNSIDFDFSSELSSGVSSTDIVSFSCVEFHTRNFGMSMCVVLECAFIFSRVCCSLFLLLLAINYLNLIYNKHVAKIFNGKISNSKGNGITS